MKGSGAGTVKSREEKLSKKRKRGISKEIKKGRWAE